MQKKRILFIITQYEFGGAQRFLMELTARLDRSVFDIEIAHGNEGDKGVLDYLSKLAIPLHRIKPLVRDVNPLKDIRAIFALRKLIRKISPDTVFLLSSKAGFLGTIASLFVFRYSSFVIRSKVIYRIGGWAFNDPRPSWQKFAIRLAERILSRWRDIVIVNSRHDYDQALEKNIVSPKKLHLVYNGIDPFRLELMNRDDARKELGLSSDAFVVGTIANDYPSKGLSFLPKSVRYELSILKGIPDAYRYLTAFDIFVSPSLKEGFSWALLEAMAAKIPVIATKVGAAGEMINDGENGFLVLPGDSTSIINAINKLLDNDSLCLKFAIEGHQTVLHRFDIQVMVKEISDLL